MVRLVIGDLHAPFEHESYLKFLKKTKKRFGAKEVISIGDLGDQHAVSRFLKHPHADGPRTEWLKTQEVIKKYNGELGIDHVIIGNHDSRMVSRSREGGLPDEWLKPLPELYGLPKVPFSEELIRDDVLYIHGVAAGGKSGWQDYCRLNGMSTVIGHYHSIGGTRYHTMRNGRTLFTLCTGCGVDRKKYAFEYAKGSSEVPVIGAGIVIDSKEAYFIPFKG